jgi:pimeloyl-ACP methyl ester carboxylesterase
MSSILDFRWAGVRVSFRGRSRSAGKATGRRRARLEVVSLEERTLLSGTAAHGLMHGALAAAHVRAGESRSATMAASSAVQSAESLPTVPLVERLGYYDTDDAFPHFVQVNSTNMATLQAKLQNPNVKVYVLVHGLAQGAYETWVDRYANGYDPGDGPKLPANNTILDWWQTIPENYSGGVDNENYKHVLAYAKGLDLGPVSPWLLEGHWSADPRTTHSPPPIRESDNGLAWDLAHDGDWKKGAKVDPNAVVLAYSWLDDAATSSLGYTAEAATELNGARLAAALEQLIDPAQAAFQGRLQLIGHSFGSKVATVAADALETGAATPIHVSQLTILDSPETANTSPLPDLADTGDANDLWYFLPDLDISKDPSASQTFVDSYWSLLGEPYSNNSYSPMLKQVVDVHLQPDQYSSSIDSWRHTYAAEWYAGSTETKAGLAGRNRDHVGRQWSPLVSGHTVPQSQSYVQDWLDSKGRPIQAKQFKLVAAPSFAVNPDVQPAPLTPQGGGSSQTSVTLTQADPTQTFTFQTTAGTRGLEAFLFDYQFTNFVAGDELQISYPGVIYGSYVGFEVQPFTFESGPPTNGEYKQLHEQKGTISNLVGANTTYTLTFTLTTTSSNSSVTVSNFNQYGYLEQS